MKTQTICNCERCQKGSYNPQDYVIPEEKFLQLNNPRPFGISGHLRAMNEALTVAECIDSCIDGLDELIITYNDSEDNTEEILKEYAAKYPDKIRLYHYKPWVAPAARREVVRYNYERFDEFRAEGNIHSPANYNNFGYTKISFSHYMKIDGDQIYFTNKILILKRYLFLGRSLAKICKSKIIRFGFKIFTKIISKINKHLCIISRIAIAQHQECLNFGGVELVLDKKELCVLPTNEPFERIWCFNSCYEDYLLWEPKDSRYKASAGFYECMHLEKVEIIDAGFLWCHFGAIKIKTQVPAQTTAIPLQKFKSMSWKNILKVSNHFEHTDLSVWHISRQFEMGENFWDLDRKYLFNPSYQKSLDNILKKCIDF